MNKIQNIREVHHDKCNQENGNIDGNYNGGNQLQHGNKEKDINYKQNGNNNNGEIFSGDHWNHHGNNQEEQNSQYVEEFDIIMKKGEMVRVLRRAFRKDEFVVDHIYNGIRAELTRKKVVIVRNNIHLLLDYYEKVLELREPPMISRKSLGTK